MAEWKNMTLGTPSFSGEKRRSKREEHDICVATLPRFKGTKAMVNDGDVEEHTPVIVRKVMEMSRLTAQFTAATTDAALPLTPIGKISLTTTYTTGTMTRQG